MRDDTAIALMLAALGHRGADFLPRQPELGSAIQVIAAQPDVIGSRIVRERRDEQVIAFRADIAREDGIEAVSQLRNGETAVGRAAEVGPLKFHQPECRSALDAPR